MFTETGLRKIKDFSANDPIISLYLNTEPSQGNSEAHRLRLRNMLKDIYLEQDVKAIEKFFNYTYDWSGRSVAVFSCAPANFFQAISLSMPVKDFIKVGSRTAVEPLEDMLEEFSNLGVILVDKEGARFFHFYMGEMVAQQEFKGEEVKQVKIGGSTSTHSLRGGALIGSRTIVETIDRNFREAAEKASKFMDSKRVRRIMIGGTDENVSRFRALLPKSLQSLIVRTFAMSKNVNHAEIRDKVMYTIETG